MPENEQQPTPAKQPMNLKTEIKDGELYLTVLKEDRNIFDLEELKKKVMETGIMNADLKKIEEVILRARGIPEHIGKPFRFYDRQKDDFIFIDVSSLTAKVLISSMALAEQKRITKEDVLFRLKKEKICYGIEENQIVDMIDGRKHDEYFIVARGKAPKNGMNAKIEEVVEIDVNAKPVETHNGFVDFKNIETFKQIVEGEVIAIKYPPTKGTPGINIFGKPIEATPGKDIKFPLGKNTCLSENDTKMVAAIGGFLYRQDNLICVGEVFIVKGNVDFSSGNIKYQGNTIINGNVNPDFKVESEGDIVIKGLVEGAEIVSRHGNVDIRKGILGRNKTRVYAGKNIKLLFAQNASIEAGEDLTVKKNLLHCSAKAETVSMTDFGSSIVGGNVSVYKDLDVFDAGSNKTIATTIRAIDQKQESIEKKIKDITALEEKISPSVKPLRNRIKMMGTMIQRDGKSVTHRSRDEFKKVTEEHECLLQKLEYISYKKSEFEKIRNAPPQTPGRIRVAGSVYPNVTIEMYNKKTEIKKTEKSKQFSYRDNAVVCSDYEKPDPQEQEGENNENY